MTELDESRSRELDALRNWDAGADPLDTDARHRARTRLLRAMNEQGQKSGGRAGIRRPLWRSPLLRTLVSGAVAAALAATVLVNLNDGGGSGQPTTGGTHSPAMQDVSAQTVLNRAAAYERKHEKAVVPRDDQFIYTKEIIKETDKATGATKAYTDENWRSVDGSKRSWIMEIGHGWWAPPLGKGESEWPPQKWSTLKALPTDPEQLILAASNFGLPPQKGQTIDDLSTDDWDSVEFALSGLLKLVPVMPEGLRPAAYEALGMVPGVKAVPGQKDAKGRTGVAIVYDNPKSQMGNSDSWFIFNPTTYAFLGFRDIRTSDDHKGKAKKTYIQLSYLDSWAVTDRVKQRP